MNMWYSPCNQTQVWLPVAVNAQTMRQVPVRKKNSLFQMWTTWKMGDSTPKAQLAISGQARDSYRELVGIWEGKLPRGVQTCRCWWEREIGARGGAVGMRAVSLLVPIWIFTLSILELTIWSSIRWISEVRLLLTFTQELWLLNCKVYLERKLLTLKF